jgi:hypothetical protein
VEKYVFLALDSSKKDDKSSREMEKGPLCKIAMARQILL